MKEGRFAGLYDASFGLFLNRIQRRVVEIAGRHGCGKVIDLGCGTGAQCILFNENGFDATGMDASPKMLGVARKKSAIEYIQADITETNLPDGSFGCAILSFVLHMNDAENDVKILQEAGRIAGHKGMIIVTDYGIPSTFKGSAMGLVVKIIENLAIEDHRRNYHRYMAGGAIDALIENQNFSIVERHKFYHGIIETVAVKHK